MSVTGMFNSDSPMQTHYGMKSVRMVLEKGVRKSSRRISVTFGGVSVKIIPSINDEEQQNNLLESWYTSRELYKFKKSALLELQAYVRLFNVTHKMAMDMLYQNNQPYTPSRGTYCGIYSSQHSAAMNSSTCNYTHLSQSEAHTTVGECKYSSAKAIDTIYSDSDDSNYDDISLYL
mmetsp:Transcript_40042/g.40845  ORF Transcript_40042/g.40845 Transcript_40042/m.40845 type:complete len:176 (-) Transcript_40042:442-969(-)|eukprot:CAMPEP_0182429210 /NCGR_PEP_ID=MMETSP1167-20130531/25596_1 /TAXON_ID=2988 /ORGANISM="Mallomonas Sp, Strain CCMP3275" /LENGTH=175 /DNA_ID=CAMNT_0024612595 /DNA_START=42 /DNA_END=569 /DNA_ORIENTATION=-